MSALKRMYLFEFLHRAPSVHMRVVCMCTGVSSRCEARGNSALKPAILLCLMLQGAGFMPDGTSRFTCKGEVRGRFQR